MKNQNLLKMDFCQSQASGIHFDLPGIELRSLQKPFAMEVFTKKNISLRFSNSSGPTILHYASRR